jgi:hypothetical protein
MHAIRIALTVIGWLAIAMGLLWIGQGLGIIRWPASSFMIDMSVWSLRGLILAAAGIITLLLARRVR